MPLSQRARRLRSRRAARFNQPEAIQEAAKFATEDAEDRRGILTRIGDAFEVVDSPFRSFIAKGNLDGMTPAEFNKVVFGATPTAEGDFPTAEIATSILVSPFNFISGVGGLTKAGALAKRAQSLQGALAVSKAAEKANLPLKIAREVAGKASKGLKAGDTTQSMGAKLVELQAELARRGAPDALRKGFKAQVQAGQRGLVNFGLPFTGQSTKIPIPFLEGPVSGALEKTGRAIGKTRVARSLRGAFGRTPAGSSGDLFKLLREGGRGIRNSDEILREIIDDDILKGLDLSSPGAAEAFANVTQDVSRIDALDDFLKNNPQLGPTQALSDVLKERSILRGKVGQAGSDVEQAATQLTQLNKRITAEQLEAGGRGVGSFVDDEVGYVRRLLTPKGREFVRAHKLEDSFGSMAAKSVKKHGLDTFDPTQMHRNANFRNKYTSDINKWARSKGFEGDFFDLDPTNIFTKVLKEKGLSTFHAEILQQFVKSQAVTKAHGGIPLAKFIADTNLFKLSDDVVKKMGGKSGKSGISFAKNFDDFNINGIQKVLDDAGLGLYEVPLESAQAFAREVAPITDPSSAGFLKLWDTVNQAMANALTQPFLAFHFRNGIGNGFQMMMAGMRPDEIGGFVAKAWMEAKNNPDELARLIRIGARQFGAGQAAQFVAPATMKKGVKQMFKGAKSVKDVFALPFRLGAKGGQAIENTMRHALFLWARDKKGLAEFEAVNLVNKHLFDYTRLTDFERAFPNRLIFFYRWVSNALPWLAQSAFENPKMFRLMQQLSTGGGAVQGADPGLPSFLRETGALPAGKTLQGERQVIGSLGLPIEELRRLDLFAKKPPGSGPVGLPFSLAQSAFNKLAESSVPTIKSPLELIADRDFFLDRPISENDRAPAVLRNLPEDVSKALLGFEVKKVAGKDRFRMNPLTLWLIRNSPLSRFLSTAGKFDDPRFEEVIPGLAARSIVQLLSGVRLSSFDELDSTIKNARKVINEDMREAQQSGKGFFIKRFIAEKDERTGLAPPEMQYLMNVNNQLSKLQQLSRERQARQAQFEGQ